MRIDAHHHVWDLAIRPQPWTAPFPVLARSYSLDDLRPALAAAEIDATVAVQTVTVADETSELLALADRDSLIAGVVGWVDLAAPGGHHLVGIRHQVQEERGTEWFARPEVLNGLRAVAHHGLAYDLIVRNDQVTAARSVAQSIPELRFVLDHGGNPDIESADLDPWRQDISTLAALPNVVVKLSGLVTRASATWRAEQLRPYGDHLLSAFGAYRVLFGSDWPVCLLRCGYGDVVASSELLTAELNADERAAVFGGNAATWYRLSTTR
jgi:L-fuconolactonase